MSKKTFSIACASLGMAAACMTAAGLDPVAQYDAKSFMLGGISDRDGTPGPNTDPTDGNFVGTCDCYWDNGLFPGGGFDGNNAQASQDGGAFPNNARAADDFYLAGCNYYRMDSVYALILTNAAAPATSLEVYTDCDGVPADLIATFPQVAAERIPAGDSFGLQMWEICYDGSDCWLPGECMYWASPVGAASASDAYFVATANAGEYGKVQGNQAHFIANGIGYTDWTPISVTNVGKSDLAIAVCTTICSVLWDNGKFDGTGGAPSFINQANPKSRAADDFLVPPCDGPYRVDLVQACVLTNCECGEFLLEIYESTVDTMCPAEEPLYELGNPTKVTPLNQTLTTSPDGFVVDAFQLQWDLTGQDIDLDPGMTYWLSAVGQGTASATDRTFFCYSFKCEKDCQILLQESKVFLPPYEGWEFTSERLNESTRRELAFVVCGGPVADGGDNASSFAAADFNQDGTVDSTDFFAFIAAFLNG